MAQRLTVVPRLGRRASTSPVSPRAARGRGTDRWLRRLRQAQPPAPAARADRPAGRFPLGRRQDAERPRLDGRRSGPGARAERLAAAQGGQSLRLRALRHRASRSPAPRWRSTPRARTGRACAGPTSRARSRWPSSRSSRARRWPRTPTPQSVYVADVPFKRNGKQAVVAIAKLDGRLLVTNGFRIHVARHGAAGPPGDGDKAISSTPRRSTDVGGDAAHSTRAARSPRTCYRPTSPTSSARSPSSSPSRRRCCARAASAARSSTSSSRSGRVRPGVAFIHQEIYKDNAGQQGRPLAGGRLALAQRALDLRHRSQRQDQHALRGRLLGRRAAARRGQGRLGCCSRRGAFLFLGARVRPRCWSVPPGQPLGRGARPATTFPAAVCPLCEGALVELDGAPLDDPEPVHADAARVLASTCWASARHASRRRAALKTRPCRIL